MSQPALSIVVIGRNEEARLGPTFESLRAIPMDYEVLYVDSASGDRSVEVAARHGARIARLVPSPHLCAAAGRYVGTLLARARWILYLDGDMELTPEFARQIPEWLCAAEAAPGIGGFVGLYQNVHEDGSVRSNLLRQRLDRTEANTFGGAVVASRAAVLSAGNWDFRVSSYEELDLHSRLNARSYAVRLVPTTMVIHHVARPNPVRLLFRMFFPFGKAGRRMRGIGEVLRSRARAGSLLQFVRFYRYPFVYLALVASGVILSLMPFRGSLAGLGLVACGVVYTTWTRGIRSTAVFLSFPLRIVLGIAQYPKEWQPEFNVVEDHV